MQAKQEKVEPIKEAMKELPCAQRAVALCLKSVFDQLKELARLEREQIDQKHTHFLKKFNEVEQKASKIIAGKPLTAEDLPNTDKYFTPSEQAEFKETMKTGYKLPEFWLQVLRNSAYRDSIEEADTNLWKHIVSISTNVTTSNMEVYFQVEDSPILKGGIYKRSIFLENGFPVHFQGDEIKLQQISELGKILWTNTKEKNQVLVAFELMGEIINQMVPYALIYYLGINEQIQDSQAESESEQQNVGSKKIKP